MTSAIEARGLRVERGARVVLDDVSLTLAPGERLAVVGANGSGKSTLLRALLGLERLARGEVRLRARALASLSRLEIARTATLVLQDTHVEAPITVRDLVTLGRHPHRGRPEARHDAARIREALARADIVSLADRDVRTLSGGELQRAHLARALAQDCPILLLDEPTASLDLGHQIALLDLLAELGGEGRAVCVVLHDLALAARWAERILVLAEGRVLACGAPREVLTRELLAEGFAVDARVRDVEGELVITSAHARSTTREAR